MAALHALHPSPDAVTATLLASLAQQALLAGPAAAPPAAAAAAASVGGAGPLAEVGPVAAEQLGRVCFLGGHCALHQLVSCLVSCG